MNKKQGTAVSHPQQIKALSGADYTREETYCATRLPVTLASTIVPDAYRSDEFHQVERERIWSGGWVCVGYTSRPGGRPGLAGGPETGEARGEADDWEPAT